MTNDRLRKFPRISADFSVTYNVNEATAQAPAITLGGGGLFLGVAQSLTPGTEMVVRFRAAKHLPLVEARARVCYQVPGKGVGIEFTEIEPENQEQILRLIFHRIGDKRRYPRAPFATQVEHEGGAFIDFSKDISTRGMSIETGNTLAAGSTLLLRFHIDEGTICKANAEVRYEVKKLGMGVQFTSISPEDQGRIETYLAHTIG